MNTFVTTVWLSLGGLIAYAQAPIELDSEPQTGSELQIGYVRETYKMRDLQASPMLYIANVNGLKLAYTRLTTRNQWRASLMAGLGNFIAPGLGIRPLKFAADQTEPLWLAPTLYRGRIELEYRRLLHRNPSHTNWVGIGLHNTVGYSDGLVLSTWALNTAAASVLYQSQINLGKKQTIILDASLPVVAVVSRMPYSNVVSEPERSNTATFFGGSRWATLGQFLNPQLGATYRFRLNSRVAFQAAYHYNWLRYAEPQLIRAADHQATGSVIYMCQRQHR